MFVRYLLRCPCRATAGSCACAAIGTADQALQCMVDHLRLKHGYQDTPELRILIGAMLMQLPAGDGAHAVTQAPIP